MNGTSNLRGKATRLAAAAGTVAMAFALTFTSLPAAQATSFPQPDLSKKPQMNHLLNQDFGTKGVTATVRVLDYVQDDATSRLYGEARVAITVTGFRGPVTVWSKNRGSASVKNADQPWQKTQARPKNGTIVVVVPLARLHHCAALAFRVHDNDGQWTKVFTEVRVRATEEPHDSGGGTIDW